MGRLVRVVLILCRGPAGEKGHSVLGGAVGFGAVGGKGQPGVGREFHDLVGEAEVAYDWVMELFGAGSVQSHVVGGPPIAEGLAAGGQLADEVGQVAVVGLRPLDAQHGDSVFRGVVPVRIERGGVWVEKAELARFTGRDGSAYAGEYRATASRLAARRSRRPLSTIAGARQSVEERAARRDESVVSARAPAGVGVVLARGPGRAGARVRPRRGAARGQGPENAVGDAGEVPSLQTGVQ